eukprot:m.88761 g.88761  ORF g.88761 m.88761 type:complete len:103 (+) comp14833_c0_seq1:624-932(+)
MSLAWYDDKRIDNSAAGPIAASLVVDCPNNSITNLAQDVLQRSLQGIAHALPSFGPDGVWPEGLGYQGYALQHALLSARFLVSSLGYLSAPCNLANLTGLSI